MTEILTWRFFQRILWVCRLSSHQLYVCLETRYKADISSSLENLEHFTADIQLWMISNLLKLILKKTNVIHVASSSYSKSLNYHTYKLVNPSKDTLVNIHYNHYYYIHKKTSVCLSNMAMVPAPWTFTSTGS